MKFLSVTLIALFASLFFWYCKSPKHTFEQLPANQIRWGSGGGFTGKENLFVLLENGQIFKQEGLTNTNAELKATKSKNAKALFESAKSLELEKIAFSQPGNMYYFIETKNGDVTNRITWGDERAPVEQKVKDFYTVLQQLVATKE